MELPSQRYHDIIDELAVLITTPVQKLAFLNRSIDCYHSIHSVYKIFPVLAESALRKMVMDIAEDISPGSREKAGAMIKDRSITSPGFVLWRMYKYRNFLFSIFFICCLSIIVTVMPSLIEKTKSYLALRAISRVDDPGAAIKYTGIDSFQEKAYGRRNTVHLIKEYLDDFIWLVEETKEYEIYSNGLHIITVNAVENQPRAYYKFSKDTLSLPKENQISDKIIGIVYHSSESDIFPFKPEMDSSLKKMSKALIQYTTRTKCYNYFIDRFGRVYRIVREDHAADHAGKSVWMDDESYYLNLSHSFIGLCFEGKGFETVNDDPKAANKNAIHSSSHMKVRSSTINEMQIKSGMELTDWLRVKYQIPQSNCVPHGLVSVNPRKMLIGYHLDLSHGFPFSRFKLSNKYREKLPAITDFGFSYDEYFLAIFDGNPWPGILLSESLLNHNAKKSDMSLKKYRKKLKRKFMKFYKWQEAQEEKHNRDL